MATTSPNDRLLPPVLLALDAGDFSDPAAEAEIGWVVDLVTAIRSVRAEMNITAGDADAAGAGGRIGRDQASARNAGTTWSGGWRGSAISPSPTAAPEGAVQLLVRGEVAALPLKGVIDLSAEKTRLDKELAKAEADIKRVDAKLGNEKFVANAPEEIVEEEKEKREAAVARKAKILEALERLKNAAVMLHQSSRRLAPSLTMRSERSACQGGAATQRVFTGAAAMDAQALRSWQGRRWEFNSETACSETSSPSARTARAVRPPW